jgi:hypothetical protein
VKARFYLLALSALLLLSSCSAWNKVFGPKYGCPSNGKNLGAEKALDGTAPKAKKFKA